MTKHLWLQDLSLIKETLKKVEDDEDETDETVLNAVKQHQSKQSSHTCMMPQQMETEVVVNTKSTPVTVTADGSNKPIKIAPGEGKIPTNIMREENVDAKAFPRHHPSGQYGLDHKREFKLSPSQYFQQRLLNQDDRFSKDPFYVFLATSYVERHAIEQQINLSGVKGKQLSSVDGSRKIQLTDLFDVFKKVKGTPKYWQTAKNELIAKVKQLGPFHMFYTFSCGEMRWSQMFLTLLRRHGYNVVVPDKWDGSDETLLVEGKELWEFVNEDMADSKHKLFEGYTFLITLMFDARVKSFVKNILMGLGEDTVPIAHFSYRVEFQARGLPHIHGVCWIKKEYLLDMGISGDLMDNEAMAVVLANKLVTCRLPDPEEEPLGKIVREVQMHSHTPSCLKYSGVCRYGFPKLPSKETLIAKPFEEIYPNGTEAQKKKLEERAELVFGMARHVLDERSPEIEDMTLDEFYRKIETTEEEYEDLIRISKRGKVLILQREVKERFVNNYNQEMLTAWDANLDLQIVVDPYAVISYIASYMNKEETQTTPFLREALFSTAGKETKERLKALKDAYITHRQVGASEAVYKVLPSLRLKDSNIACLFVVTGFPGNRSRFYQKVNDEYVEDQGNDNEEEEDVDLGSDNEYEEHAPPESRTFEIDGREGTYKESINVLDRYVERPKYLKTMCLAQFAISYVYAPKVPKRIIFERGCSTEFSDQTIFNSTRLLPKYISLGDSGLGKMRLRAFPAVMRIHSSKKKIGHEQHYSELLLYTSWTDEEEEFHPNDKEKCQKEFKKRLDQIQANKEMIYPGEGTTELLESFDYAENQPQHVYDMLDSQRQQEEEEDKEIGATDDPEYETFGYTGNLGQENSPFESSKYRKIKMPNNDVINFLTRRLVPEQLDVLRRVVGYCKDVVKNEKDLSHKVTPLKIVVHGGAGEEF